MYKGAADILNYHHNKLIITIQPAPYNGGHEKHKYTFKTRMIMPFMTKGSLKKAPKTLVLSNIFFSYLLINSLVHETVETDVY